ncbi:ceramidase-domain-containing protein [Fimicolochytrium jonesii]|uniref:ceramidase-domain-containing protein n=1 Tax=Fimicolochytrium jonesii TaxID=1396493 RepID=UPI0022FE6CC6|nr:ceramidase-domain-containing protein [Fimicolochytrium jonesii]KAI8822113.1 ceramidase-domain-containing protein [Fimicolochytrium jonesii]
MSLHAAAETPFSSSHTPQFPAGSGQVPDAMANTQLSFGSFFTSNKTIDVGLEGYWGPVTSTLDWCEENYIVNYYLAEYWNSLSNLVYIVLPLVGLRSCVALEAEPRYYLSYVALMLVGVGSFLFHGTLTFFTQLLDEVPMMAATCIFLYAHMQMFNKKTSYAAITALALTFFVTSGSYIILKTPIVFQMSFITLAALQLAVAVNNIGILRLTDKPAANTVSRIATASVTAMVVAFVVWNLDQAHCGTLQEKRREIGYPFRVGLELHALWHLFSGYGGYAAVVGSQYCRLKVLGRSDVRVALRGWILPVIALNKSKTA